MSRSEPLLMLLWDERGERKTALFRTTDSCWRSLHRQLVRERRAHVQIYYPPFSTFPQ